MHRLWRQFPGRQALLNLCDDEVCCRGHHSVEVLLSHPVDKVAGCIRGPRPDQCDIGPQSRLKYMPAAADLFRFPSFGQHSAGRRRCVEPAYPGPARPNRLRHRALRHHFKLDCTRLCSGNRFRIAGKERADRLLDLPVTQQAPPTKARLTYVVGDIGQFAHARIRQRMQYLGGIARHAESAHQNCISGLDQSSRFCRRDLR